jgi:hypothetical protein
MDREIVVKVSQQKLYLLERAKVVRVYPISTSRFGIGNNLGSNKTPIGLHRISNKIGRGASIGAMFVRRRNTGKVVRIKKRVVNRLQDLITTRILRLEGLERGVNRGAGIDSFQRCVYIHGTSSEGLIGKPASHGCIRMKNRDVIELFNLVKRNMLVNIKK